MNGNLSEPTITRRTLLKTGIAALASTALAGCNIRSSKRAEVILTEGGSYWGKAQHAAYYRPFEQETGIRVRTVPFVMPGKLRTSIEQKRPIIDVADMSGADLPAFVRDGLLTSINRSYFDARDLAALAPLPAQPYAIPSMYAATVLAYRREIFPEREPDGWSEAMDLSHHVGPRTVASGSLGQMGATFEVALLADGVSPDKLYPLDWDRALRQLSKLRPSIAKYWMTSGEALQLLSQGEAVAGNIWNGPIDTSEARSAGNLFTWNQGIVQAGYWAIPKGSPNVENAHRFMAFALRPDRQAHFARLIGYGPSNSSALSLLNSQRVAHLPTAPVNLSRTVLQNYDWWAREDKPGITNLALAVRLWERWVAA